MSEPMSSVEIEDVLSSIRRLVSEDLRPQSPRVPAPDQQPVADDGRLLLTPALRVVSSGDAAPEQPVEDAAADDIAAEAPLQLTDPAPEADAGGEGAESGLEADDVTGFADEGDGAQVFAADTRSDDPAYADETVTAWDEDSPTAEAGAAAAAVEDVVASFAQVHDGDWEPETGDSLDDHPALHWADGAWAEPVRGAARLDGIDSAEEAELAVVETSDAGLAAWGGPDYDQDPEDFSGLAEAAAAADPVAADTLAEAERADEIAAEAADRAEAEAIAAIEEIAPDLEAAAMARMAGLSADEDSDPGLFDAADDGFDEEALRDLVRDIIREELQGALGERITRNVRKLVRVEVARALAAQEFL